MLVYVHGGHNRHPQEKRGHQPYLQHSQMTITCELSVGARGSIVVLWCMHQNFAPPRTPLTVIGQMIIIAHVTQMVEIYTCRWCHLEYVLRDSAKSYQEEVP